ncbi:beta-glucan synthesis-associated [Amylostereum chailletii]|nr:beta-glucan synthesis-associated [Amylostereum chailletii]
MSARGPPGPNNVYSPLHSNPSLLTPGSPGTPGQEEVHAALLRPSRTPSTASFSPSVSGINKVGGGTLRQSAISAKFSLPADPSAWSGPNVPEPDDALHNPDPRRDKRSDMQGNIFTMRGLANLGCLAFLVLGILTLFAGYPIISYFKRNPLSTNGAFNIGGTNASGQVPDLLGHAGLIDVDTPKSAYTRASYKDPSKSMQLVWSDEFNVEGRSFYPGDDPYWEALNLNYWQTVDVEWYDPAAVSTANGALELTLSKKSTHNLDYQGGMVTTWNKFCFTGGLIEAAVTLPGAPNILGFWPAVWTMGNLGRVGYGATTEGLWPYSYDACDFGALPNQTLGGLPAATLDPEAGDQYHDNKLSFLPGQRLSRCTCKGESHPGPVHSDGTYVGRASPEIDMFEAVASDKGGNSSQTGQFAPYNYNYTWPATQGVTYDIPNTDTTSLNTYRGGAYQQAVSALSINNQSCYELETGCFAKFAFEYKPGFDDSYITWDPLTEISARPVPQEPMYIIANLGMSESFVAIDFEHLTFPAKMRVDYVRVYQDPDSINVGCDPEDFPTQAYINTYIGAYTNPNYTTWEDYGQTFPKNSKLDTC